MSDAIWALIGVVIGIFGNSFFNWLLQKKQFEHNKEMFSLQNKSSEKVKAILYDLLNHRSYTDRSFISLKAPIGGYSDKEIRQFLHEIGAKKVNRKDNSEWWFLLSRESERIAKQKNKN